VSTWSRELNIFISWDCPFNYGLEWKIHLVRPVPLLMARELSQGWGRSAVTGS
jgi:hypothetical protein